MQLINLSLYPKEWVLCSIETLDFMSNIKLLKFSLNLRLRSKANTQCEERGLT